MQVAVAYVEHVLVRCQILGLRGNDVFRRIQVVYLQRIGHTNGIGIIHRIVHLLGTEETIRWSQTCKRLTGSP